MHGFISLETFQRWLAMPLGIILLSCYSYRPFFRAEMPSDTTDWGLCRTRTNQGLRLVILILIDGDRLVIIDAQDVCGTWPVNIFNCNGKGLCPAVNCNRLMMMMKSYLYLGHNIIEWFVHKFTLVPSKSRGACNCIVFFKLNQVKINSYEFCFLTIYSFRAIKSKTRGSRNCGQAP